MYTTQDTEWSVAARFRAGHKLQNGATVLYAERINDPDYGMPYLILATWGDRPFQEWIVWRADKHGNCESGAYHATFESAVTTFKRKKGALR